MSTEESPLRFDAQEYIMTNYKNILNTKLINQKSLTEDSIAEFQKYLNAAQPVTDSDKTLRSLIHYLYRKNPLNFCKYLVKSRLSHLILWTESKYIARHLGLQGVVYIKWNNTTYDCSLHNNYYNNKQGDVTEASTYSYADKRLYSRDSAHDPTATEVRVPRLERTPYKRTSARPSGVYKPAESSRKSVSSHNVYNEFLKLNPNADPFTPKFSLAETAEFEVAT